MTLYSQNPVGGATYTLSAQPNQNIVITTAFAQTTTLAPGDVIKLSVLGGNWVMSGGTTGVSLARLASLAASKSSTGYQKLPSGLIIQWGQFVQNDNGTALVFSTTLPIAFPNGGLQGFLTPGNAVPNSGSATVEGLTANVINGFTNANTATRTWRYFVIGY